MRIPSVPLAIAGAILALGVALRIADPEPVARLRLSVFDTYQRLEPRHLDPSLPVRVVDIDEASLQRLGQWPWPRSRLAEILERLADMGAQTIALDLILSEPDRLSPAYMAREFEKVPALKPLADLTAHLPSNDEELARAISKVPVVLGLAAEKVETKETPPQPRARLAYSGDEPQSFAPRFPGGIGPLPVLTAESRGLGAVNWLPASDQIVRGVPLLVTIGDTIYPSLSLEQLRLANNETTLFVRSSGGSGLNAFGKKTGIENVRVGSVDLPTGADGQLWLKFALFDRSRYIPAHLILDGTLDAKEVAGRHIIIGASATGLLDLRATPLDASVPGVEIHAQALEQMLAGEHLVRPAWATGAEIIFIIAAGAVLAWLMRRTGPVSAALTGLSSIAVVLAGSWLAYTAWGLLLDPVYPALVLTALYVASSLYTYVKTETDRARIRAAFGHYVAPSVVDELAANQDKLKLGGEMRQITLLFADVRGFSKLSEGMEADELIRYVNRLFTPLADIILDERGTIDKFMGDAVMAFWNAPVTDPDHTARACRTALRMIDKLVRLNEEWAAEARASGRKHETVRIGIGLNTGECCVGNVGSPQRFDYSILGDVVNVASRLEEATKTYGVSIIAGEHTVLSAPGLAFLEIDRTTPRGKERAERIYALIGDEPFAMSPRFAEIKARHAALVAAIASGDKAASAGRLEALVALNPAGLSGLMHYYKSRVAGMP